MTLGIASRSTNIVVDRNRSLIQAQTSTRFLPHEILGCGSYGCVYKTDDPSIVFKISSDPTEFVFIDLAMKLGEFPEGIVEYYKAIHLQGRYKGRDLFGIWRESAHDVGEVIDDSIESHRFFEFYLEDVFRASAIEMMDLLEDYPNLSSSPISVHWEELESSIFPGAKRNMSNWIKKMLVELPPQIQLDIGLELCYFAIGKMKLDPLSVYVADALEFYLDRGILLADVHGGNIGRVFREDLGEIVAITDPGHAVILSDGTNLGESWYK